MLAENKRVSDITVGELTELIRTIVFEFVKPELLKPKEISQEEKAKAWALMDELADGLGESGSPYDTADNHDKYIYEI